MAFRGLRLEVKEVSGNFTAVFRDAKLVLLSFIFKLLCIQMLSNVNELSRRQINHLHVK